MSRRSCIHRHSWLADTSRLAQESLGQLVYLLASKPHEAVDPGCLGVEEVGDPPLLVEWRLITGTAPSASPDNSMKVEPAPRETRSLRRASN